MDGDAGQEYVDGPDLFNSGEPSGIEGSVADEIYGMRDNSVPSAMDDGTSSGDLPSNIEDSSTAVPSETSFEMPESFPQVEMTGEANKLLTAVALTENNDSLYKLLDTYHDTHGSNSDGIPVLGIHIGAGADGYIGNKDVEDFTGDLDKEGSRANQYLLEHPEHEAVLRALPIEIEQRADGFSRSDLQEDLGYGRDEEGLKQFKNDFPIQLSETESLIAILDAKDDEVYRVLDTHSQTEGDSNFADGRRIDGADGVVSREDIESFLNDPNSIHFLQMYPQLENLLMKQLESEAGSFSKSKLLEEAGYDGNEIEKFRENNPNVAEMIGQNFAAPEVQSADSYIEQPPVEPEVPGEQSTDPYMEQPLDEPQDQGMETDITGGQYSSPYNEQPQMGPDNSTLDPYGATGSYNGQTTDSTVADADSEGEISFDPGPPDVGTTSAAADEVRQSFGLTS